MSETETATPPPTTPPAKPTAIDVRDKTDKTPIPFGVGLTTFDEASRLATAMAKSDLVPKGFREKPYDVLVAMQMGAELGFAPMQALQSIAVINGRPGLYGDGLLAVVMRSRAYEDHDEAYEVKGERVADVTVDDLKLDTTAAVCTFVRRGKSAPVSRRFSVGDAKLAKLWGKEGPWREYPARMLAMRARSFAARDTFPDVLRGVHTVEELHDVPAEDPPTPPRLVHRLSERPTPDAPPVAEVTSTTVHRIVRVDPAARTVTLDDGVVVLCDPTDVSELAKFVDTDHKLTITIRERRGVAPMIEAFAIAD
jgi:hypothetical protein